MTLATFHAKVPLTRRELTTAVAVAEGKTRKEIALELGLSIKTVDYFMTGNETELGVRGKLGFHDPAHLAHWLRDWQDTQNHSRERSASR